MAAALVVAEGKPLGAKIPLKHKRFSIGRDPKCNLRPNSDLVSKVHCIFDLGDHELTVSDPGSTNGTFVNGDRIAAAPVKVRHGDRIAVGPLVFAVELDLPAPPKPEPKPKAKAAGGDEEDSMMEWLLAGDDGEPGEPPSEDSTVLDLKAYSQEQIAEAEAVAEKEIQEKGPTEAEKSAAEKVADAQADTRAAAQEILNRYMVRRRT